MKPTIETVDGTSFFGNTIYTSVSELIRICGDPIYDGNDGSDKVNFEWHMETSDGHVFTIYDWKEYRSLSMNESVEFHIGGYYQQVTEQAQTELLNALLK